MKTALITGASGGIGGAAALAFAKAGYRVVLACHTNRTKAETLLSEITASGGQGMVLQADLKKEADVLLLFEKAEAQFGFIDVLVNNAGISHYGLFTDMSLSDWQNLLAVNLTAAFLCSRRALIPMIREKTGCIINISSVWGQTGAACEAAYSATKAGLIGLTKALAQEEGPSGIRVNCIAPGLIETDMNAHLNADDLAAFCEEIPLTRAGTPHEVAHAALFLAQNPYITGQVLGINGGLC